MKAVCCRMCYIEFTPPPSTGNYLPHIWCFPHIFTSLIFPCPQLANPHKCFQKTKQKCRRFFFYLVFNMTSHIIPTVFEVGRGYWAAGWCCRLVFIFPSHRYSPLNGYGISGGKDALFTLPQALHKMPFLSIFQFHKTPFQQQSQNFTTFCSCLNFVNVQFLSLKIGQKF